MSVSVSATRKIPTTLPTPKAAAESTNRDRSDLPPQMRKYKVVFLGDQSSGKSSIIQRAIDDTFPKRYLATVGVDFVSKMTKVPTEDDGHGLSTDINESNIKLQLWDTAGQERFKASVPSYIRDSHVAVITWDISSRAQFDNIGKWVQQVRSIRGDDAVIWLVATKVDLPLHERQVPWLEMEEKARQHNLECMEVSAKAGYNIRELFHEITQKLPSLLQMAPLSAHSARF